MYEKPPGPSSENNSVPVSPNGGPEATPLTPAQAAAYEALAAAEALEPYQNDTRFPNLLRGIIAAAQMKPDESVAKQHQIMRPDDESIIEFTQMLYPDMDISTETLQGLINLGRSTLGMFGESS